MNRSIALLSGAVAAVLAASVGLVALTLPNDPPLPLHPAGWAAAGDSPTTKVEPKPFPPSGKVFLGVQTNLGPYDFTPVDAFTTAINHQPAVLQFTQGWAEDKFDAERLDTIVAKGMLPIVSWEPWDYKRADDYGNQPAYRLSAVASGAYDSYIRSWAAGIAALPYPVVIRFAHEMNGFWYPWCEQSNGNKPGDYVRAWRHVHDLFAAAGAHNVAWMWSPNVTYPGAEPLSRFYPGDSYVDWIGLSGYYGTAGREQYISFDEIFSSTLTELATLAHKPIVIAETGATNATGQRVQWIHEMFNLLPLHPEVIGVIWFEATREIDWRIAGVPSAAAAFATGASDARYDAPWSTAGVPRTR
jgi:Glycosyl hydrolase family 26